MANKGDDYTIQLGLDTKSLESQYKTFYTKLEKIQGKLLGSLRKEAKSLSMIATSRKDTLSIMQRQLSVQRKINALQGIKRTTPAPKDKTQATHSPRSRYDANLTSSQKERVTLASRMDAASSKTFGGVDGDFAARIKKAQLSIKALKAELKGTNNFEQIVSIKQQFKRLNGEISDAVRGQQRLNKSMKRGTAIGRRFGSSMRSSLLNVASAYTAISAAHNVFKVGKEFDGMRAGLLAASDDAASANSNFTFLLDTAKRLGTDVESGVRGFNRLGVSMRGADFNAAEIKEVFTAAQEATATFQLDAQRSNLVMLAMSQMASKGKISSEELVRQLSENLPIAMQAAEEATGKSAKEIYKMMERGELLAKDFLVPFANAMRRIVRENGALQKATEKLTSQQNRLKTAYKEMVDFAFQAGAANTLGDMFATQTRLLEEHKEGLAANINIFTRFVKMASDGLGHLIKLFGSLGSLIGNIFTLFQYDNGMTAFVQLSHSLNGIWQGILYTVNSVAEILQGDFGSLSAETRRSEMATAKAIAGKFYKEEKERRMGTVVNNVTLVSNNSDAEQTAIEFQSKLEDMVSNSWSMQ